MSVLERISKLLGDPRLKNIDWEGEERIHAHRRILSEKPMMKQVFTEIYNQCMALDRRYFSGQGLLVEIGAGVSFFKQIYPEIISTDIKEADHLDKVIDAQAMDFEDGSVRALYGMNCFHHFPKPQLFFQELDRVLVKGGGCILFEPYHGFVAKRFYRAVFAELETFDKNQPGWEHQDSVVFGANQALSYVIFKRDREKFRNLCPHLEIVYQKPVNNYVRYLLSGGLNFHSLVPSALSPLLKVLECALMPVNRILALHQIIVLRKRPS